MKETDFQNIIICPDCREKLKWGIKSASCKKCSKKYLIKNSVICFLNNNDKFYENVYTRQIHYIPGKNLLKNWGFFNLVQSGILGEIKKNINPKSIVLDTGCAGGIKWLGEYANTVGLDISFGSLLRAKQFYDFTVQAEVKKLPFQKLSFDLIYGSYIFEHLSGDEKELFLKETQRVLKPKGKLILQFDTLSKNWLYRFASRDSQSFQRGFINIDQHIGLEYASKAISRIENNGFKIVKIKKFGTTFLQYEPTYNWLNEAYGKSIFLVKLLGKITKKIANNKYLGPIMEFCITLFDKLINPFSKLDKATRIIVIAKKI